MFQLLYKYFILNKSLALPGCGVFHFRRKPALLDFENKQFLAPTAEITFTEGDGAEDELLFTFLAKEQQLDKNKAAATFTGFSADLNQKLRSTGRLEMPGFGLLTRDDAGRLYFKPVPSITSFYSNVPIEQDLNEADKKDKVTAVNVESEVATPSVETAEIITSRKKDYWWIFAIVVAAVAIAAIAYYYNQNGSFR